jgi:predicted RNase H-related nuclease YkuK (DUF458 family)
MLSPDFAVLRRLRSLTRIVPVSNNFHNILRANFSLPLFLEIKIGIAYTYNWVLNKLGSIEALRRKTYLETCRSISIAYHSVTGILDIYFFQICDGIS